MEPDTVYGFTNDGKICICIVYWCICVVVKKEKTRKKIGGMKQKDLRSRAFERRKKNRKTKQKKKEQKKAW